MITIVLPAYNEEKALEPLLNKCCSFLKGLSPDGRIIVVNDGSTDETIGVVKACQQAGVPVELIEHECNKGLGETIKTGLLHSLQSAADNDVIVTMDADNTHDPDLIFRMAALIGEGNDVVIASRYVFGAKIIGVPLRRQFYSLGASWLFRLFFPIHYVRDYTCGYRAYRARILKQALQKYGGDFFNTTGFSCMLDILLKLRKLNAVMTEVPLILRYDLKPGKSKMNVGKTIKETLSLARKHWLD
jgi:dolichol-phosphate mannosyltransferase